MGFYRLLLAIAVLLSHIGIGFHGDLGVSAVVSFFLLSGYVMTALVDRHYNERSRILTFYLDRAMRLCPQFFFYLSLSLILIWIAHPVSPYLTGISLKKILLSLSMLPLNFVTYFFNSMVIPHHGLWDWRHSFISLSHSLFCAGLDCWCLSFRSRFSCCRILES